jgi:hypothetical protein
LGLAFSPNDSFTGAAGAGASSSAMRRGGASRSKALTSARAPNDARPQAGCASDAGRCPDGVAACLV